jgi:hypothetical protein
MQKNIMKLIAPLLIGISVDLNGCNRVQNLPITSETFSQTITKSEREAEVKKVIDKANIEYITQISLAVDKFNQDIRDGYFDATERREVLDLYSTAMSSKDNALIYAEKFGLNNKYRHLFDIPESIMDLYKILQVDCGILTAPSSKLESALKNQGLEVHVEDWSTGCGGDSPFG